MNESLRPFERIEMIRKILNESKANKLSTQSEYKNKSENDGIQNQKRQQETINRVASSEDGIRIPIDRFITYNYTKEKGNANKDVLDEKLGFSHYVNALNAFRNPDIITGDAMKFLKGNKYRAKMVNRVEEKKEKEENDKLKSLGLNNDDFEQSDEELSDKPEVPSRYYHAESKGIRWRNCQEIGHMAKNCPNESKIPLWKYCGKSHEISQICPSMIWFKWNQSGHKAIDWTMKIKVWKKWNKVGHKSSRCLESSFNSSFKHVLWIIWHKPGHFNCKEINREDYHISFAEEEVEESDDENLFSSYTIKDLRNDERLYRHLKSHDDDNSRHSYKNLESDKSSHRNKDSHKRKKREEKEHRK